jgi:hypothetical protein
MSTNTAAFFVGSGISLSSGAPTVGGITKSLLTVQWTRNGHEYWPRKPEAISYDDDREADEAQEFLRIVKGHLDGFIPPREHRETNYEDLYSAVTQFADDQTGQLSNPLIVTILNVIKAESVHL